jgi:hypothetical protein
MGHDRYSLQGGGERAWYLGEHEKARLKLGPSRESIAVPGDSQGPISGENLLELLEAVGDTHDQKDECPSEGELGPSIVQRVKDERGRVWLCMRFRNRASKTEDWYAVRMYNAEDPVFEIPEFGDIQVGGLPAERPLTVFANSLTVPAVNGATVQKDLIGDSTVWVARFDNTLVESVEFSAPLPDGYNKGPLLARFYWFSADADPGTFLWEITSKFTTDGAAMPAWGSYTQVSDSNLGNEFHHVTELSAEFTPDGTATRGGDIYFRVRRSGGTAPGDGRLSKVQVFYAKDRFSDKALDT